MGYFSSNGGYLGVWGNTGSGSLNFYGPEGVAVNQSGTTIYVGDLLNNQVKYFTAQ